MRTLYTLLVLLSMQSVAAQTHLPEAPATAPEGFIFGVVVDEKDDPIINAQGIVTQSGIQQGASVTDFDGNYRVKLLAPGEYTVTVSYAGYRTHFVEGVRIDTGEMKSVNIQLEPDSNYKSEGTGGASYPPRTIIYCTRGCRLGRPLIDMRYPGSSTVVSTPDLRSAYVPNSFARPWVTDSRPRRASKRKQASKRVASLRKEVTTARLNSLQTKEANGAMGSTSSIEIDTTALPTELPVSSTSVTQFPYIYPNPTAGVFTITHPGFRGTFQVCDATGKAVLRFDAETSGSTRADLSQQPSGVYFVRYEIAPGQWQSQRLVVKH